MKVKNLFLSVVVVTLTIAFAQTGSAQSLVGVTRWVSPFEHMFTANPAEAAVLPSLGYLPQGTETFAYNGGGSGRIPVYRLYRTNAGYREHYWTSKLDERNYLLTYAGYGDEGIAFYVYPYPVAGTFPIYRVDRQQRDAQYFLWWLISPALSPDHVLTMRVSEMGSLTSNGWTTNQYWGAVIGWAFPGTNGIN